MGARRLVALVGMLALAGCGGGAAVDHAPADPCETRVPARNPSDTLTVVLFDSAGHDTTGRLYAPQGRNREARFIFSHLYETLLTIDCHGDLRPGLAKSILEASDGWLVTLRDDAYFWDSCRVTAREVAECFEPKINGSIAIKSVDPIDDHQLLVRGYSGRPDLRLLTLPMLAVTKPSNNGWAPIGTGPWMIDESVPVAEAIVIRPVLADVPVVRFVVGNVSDARDIIDGTADAMITDDPGAIEYARAKKNVSLAPLAWDKAYMLLSPTRERRVSQGIHLDNLAGSVCESLARDAVDVDARGGSSILATAETMMGHPCFDPIGVRKSLWLSQQIVYPKSDPTARQLAERIVALATSDTSSSPHARALALAIPDLPQDLRAAGLEWGPLRKALAGGQEFGYVLALSWLVDFPHLFSLQPAHFLKSLEGKLKSEAMVPLIETRAHFIAISDRIGFVDNHTGDVRIMIPAEENRR